MFDQSKTGRNTTPKDQLLSVKQAAERLNVSGSTVYNLLNAGELRFHRVGVGRGVIRISEHSIQMYLATCEADVGPPPKRRLRRSELKHIKL